MNTPALVIKLDQPDVALTRLAAAPDRLDRKKKTLFHFPIKVALQTNEGLRKHARVTPQLKGYGVYELWCDEGTALPPGTDSAPAPLVYFAAGAAFCLASHLTKLISDRKLEVRNLEIESELSFGYTSSDTTDEGVRLERGVCLGLRCLIDIDSDEPEERLRALVRQAKGLCLAEAALAEPVAIQTLLAVNGSVVDPDVATQSGMFPPPRSIHDAAVTPSDAAS